MRINVACYAHFLKKSSLVFLFHLHLVSIAWRFHSFVPLSFRFFPLLSYFPLTLISPFQSLVGFLFFAFPLYFS